MRKDTTKKFLMRENRYLGRMISADVISFLVKQKQKKIKKLQDGNDPKIEIEYDDLIFTKMLGTKEIDVMSISNTIHSGDKVVCEASKDGIDVKVNMVYCDVGSFMMGHEDDSNNKPKPATIESPFLICEVEVDQELFCHKFKYYNTSRFNDKKNPMERVSCYDAIKFCNALSKQQGLQECYTKKTNAKTNKEFWECDFKKNGFRLPREKEWEYAAKAGTQNRWAGTDDPNKLGEYAWYNANSKVKNNDEIGITHSIATKKPNEWGIYDMSGNVYEWCWNGWDFKDTTDSSYRVIRGGGFATLEDSITLTSRVPMDASSREDYIGFRVCRTI